MEVADPLAKYLLTPLAITSDASAIDAGIPKKNYSSRTTALII